MSTKYSTGDRRLVEDGIRLTDHAILRYQQRTPEGASLDPRIAWRRGEYIRDPAVCKSPNHDRAPARVRVYKDSDGWAVAFYVVEDEEPGLPSHTPEIVATVIDFDGVSHSPTRAYLHSHGPHDPGRRAGK